MELFSRERLSSFRRLLSFVFVLSLLSEADAIASPLYAVTDLGTLGGDYRYASALNDSGQVVGQSSLSNESWPLYRGFVYSDGLMSDVGTPDKKSSDAVGINNRGEVVGKYYYGEDNRSQAFHYSNGVMVSLGSLGGPDSSATGINEEGRVVGWATTSDHRTQAFIYGDGAMVSFGAFGGPYTAATAINDKGQVVGVGTTAGNALSHAFLYEDGMITDLGTLGGKHGDATGINNNGQIVGASSLDETDYRHAFLYQDGRMIDLGTLGGRESYAFAINEKGYVVGGSDTASGLRRGFIYRNGLLQDLNDLIDPLSDWTIIGASDINEEGSITALGVRQFGWAGAYALRLDYIGPRDVIAPVPEPSSLALVVAACVGLLGRRRSVRTVTKGRTGSRRQRS